MADFVYNGFWFSPEASFTKKCLEQSQEFVTGTVTVQIFKGNGKYLQQIYKLRKLLYAKHAPRHFQPHPYSDLMKSFSCLLRNAKDTVVVHLVPSTGRMFS